MSFDRETKKELAILEGLQSSLDSVMLLLSDLLPRSLMETRSQSCLVLSSSIMLQWSQGTLGGAVS